MQSCLNTSVMDVAITIRTEHPGDEATISGIVQRAYADVAYSDKREHLMVDRLRKTDAFLPTLSLLAEVEGGAVGHLLLTHAHIRSQDAAVPTLALAPLSVVPDYQGRGVGRGLVEAAHAQALMLGFGSIVLVGIPNYYARFGYEPLSRYRITLPFSAPERDCMILPLCPDALSGVTGVVEYAAGWINH